MVTDESPRQLDVSTMTTLIVNADDFGLSESVNEGIVDAHTHGIVTSTTWLAGGDAAGAAVELAPPQLEVGLHLALTSVRPTGDPRPFDRFLDADGRWRSGFPAVLGWMRTTPKARQLVATEWQAQIHQFTTMWGRPPSHLDSHQHIALVPGLMHVMVELAVRNNVPALRVPCEVQRFADLSAPRALHRPHETLVLSALAHRLRWRARRHGLASPGSFAGFRQSGRMDEPSLSALLPRLGTRGGTVELMVHPGADDEPGGSPRRQERDALMSPRVRDALDAHGLQLGRFSDLP